VVLEGLVSKHRERSYGAGRSPNWLKIKNPNHPAMSRVKEQHSPHVQFFLGLPLKFATAP